MAQAVTPPSHRGGPGSIPGVHVGFMDKVALGQVSPCQFHSTGAPLHGKTKKLITFITGLHSKPQGAVRP